MNDKPTARGRRSAATWRRGYADAIDDVVALLQAEADKRVANGGAKAAASLARIIDDIRKLGAAS
jgi:hypothetical protein